MVSLQAAVVVLALTQAQSQTVLLDFYADWCGPCRAMDPTVKQLVAQGYPIRQINIDKERGLADRFKIRSIPCFVMLSGGREVDRVEGAVSAQRLVQMCKLGSTAAPKSPAPALAGSPAAQPPAARPAATPAGPSCPVLPASNLTAVTPAAETPAAQPQVPAQPMPSGGMKSDAEFMAATVRLRIEDTSGRSCGSGTIIDSRDGEALVLTCGHIFRDSQGKGRIEVDLFGPTTTQHLPGRLISYDLDRDVGLLSFHAPGPVAVAPVAPLELPLAAGDPIVTVGCNNGADPTVRRTRINALGKYAGPPNLVVADIPVVGRSGGGLFTLDGRVVGVCNAADPSDREGLYAALGSIYAELRRAGLEFVCHSPATGATLAAAPSELPAMPKQMPQPSELALPAPPNALANASLAKEEQSLLEEMRRRAGEGAEVIVIIRPRQNSQGKSEVLMLDRASPALLERLSAGQPDDTRQLTSLKVPNPR